MWSNNSGVNGVVTSSRQTTQGPLPLFSLDPPPPSTVPVMPGSGSWSNQKSPEVDPVYTTKTWVLEFYLRIYDPGLSNKIAT